jgi:hypothetical protein
MFWPWDGCLVYSLTNLPTLLTIFPIFFHNFLDTTKITTSLKCKPPMMRAHIPLTLWISTSYIAPMATSAHGPMMQFAMLLLPLCKMMVSTLNNNNYMNFLHPCSNLPIDKLILCSPKITFAP